MAQQVNYKDVNTSISDNGKNEMAIRVQAERADGQQVRYARTFNVSGLSKSEKEALKRHVLDSLGLGETPTPPAPPTNVVAPLPPVPSTPPAPPVSPLGDETVQLVCPSCTGQMRLEINGSGYAFTRSHRSSDNEKASLFPLTLPMKAGDYRLKYWQNGVLQMQTPFTVKAGATNTVTVK